jgi:hypothetical protein
LDFKYLLIYSHEAEGSQYFTENLVMSGNEASTFESVTRNYDHWTTEAVPIEKKNETLIDASKDVGAEINECLDVS